MSNKDLLSSRKKQLENLSKTYNENGVISWSTFKDDQILHKEKTVLLTNADFADGTLRIQQPCQLKLTENIQFNPNRGNKWLDENNNETTNFNDAVAISPNRTLDWFPTIKKFGNEQYFEPEVRFAYSLGFFAAIAIEAPNVLVNLNGYTLEQHKEHSLQQRFYANIELADQPFIPFQGPSNFGHTLITARNVYIFNGKIGRSSHHGIHGNMADGVFIEDVTFADFEVAAVSLNGSKNIYCSNVVVNNNSRSVPVIATYSAGRFIKRFVERVQELELSDANLDNAITNLNTAMDNTFNALIFGNGTVPTLFENPSGLIDGNAYGILFNPNGVAVNGFLEGRNSNKANETTNIWLENCSINGIHAKINEIVAVTVGSEDGSAAQVDTAGALLQFFDGVANEVEPNKYFYQGTLLSEVQLELARIKLLLQDEGKNTSFFGTLNIPKETLMWKDNVGWYFIRSGDELTLYNGENPVEQEGLPIVWKIKCNGDSMFHVNKGVIGLKIDGVNCLCVDNSTISDIKNVGELGSLLAGNYETSHPAQGSLLGYQGTKTYGLTLCAVNNTDIKNLNICDVNSKNGCTTGLSVFNESYNTKFADTVIKSVVSEGVYDPEGSNLPNTTPLARGIFVDSSVKNTHIKNLNISEVSDNTPYNKPCEFNSVVQLG